MGSTPEEIVRIKSLLLVHMSWYMKSCGKMIFMLRFMNQLNYSLKNIKKSYSSYYFQIKIIDVLHISSLINYFLSHIPLFNNYNLFHNAFHHKY